jgi:hypothetical protein
MKRRLASVFVAIAAIFALASPIAAGGFPEQPGALPACAVVQDLPKDVIGHLFGVSPAAAERLIALLTDACLGG